MNVRKLIVPVVGTLALLMGAAGGGGGAGDEVATPVVAVAATSNCHPSYEPPSDQPCVPEGPDLDCPEIGYQVKVVGPDEYRLDADKDGWGCESYA